MNFSNGELIKLTEYILNNAESASYPSYSPDGLKILFSQTTATSQSDTITAALFKMNIDGTDKELIYQNTTSYFQIIRFPIYSNNMEKIFFVYGGLVICNSDGTDIEFIDSGFINSDQISTANEYIVYGHSYDIYSYNYNTGVMMNLGNGENPDISPDGTKITFYDYDLYVMNIDGSNRTKIANSSNISQSFSADGERIVFYGEINHSSKRDKNPLE